ncbi:MAG TPA: MarR family winged helix-turn-helix transcriptional regulator [Citricoccus sp.]
MDARPLEALVYEHMLLSRYALQGAPPYGREAPIDRSAAVLLARLEAEGPLTVAELAQAFDLDVSTVHRQVAAAMRNGLIERMPDPAGGAARKHRPSEEGARRLAAELEARRAASDRVTADWPDEDLATFVRLLRRFNEGVEQVRGRPWPRPE